MNIAVLTFDGFNELDSFVVAALLNRTGLKAFITAPNGKATSMFGVEVQAQKPLSFAREADAVIVGSGARTAEMAANAQLMAELQLDPSRQMIASQCSGVLVLAALGLVKPGALVCTDLVTAPSVEAVGLTLSDRPFRAEGNVATAGGCFASQYIAAWLIDRAVGAESARAAIWYAAPLGEKELYADRAMAAIA